MRSKKRFRFSLLLALALILIGSIGAMLLQTNGFKVKVKDLYIPTENQKIVHALVYIPKEASVENKCPVVITSHGWLNSAEIQDAASIELSRRGFVVIAMDAYAHGLSSTTSDLNVDLVTKSLGMIPLVEYVYSGIMDYVDTERIGVMGHSLGGFSTAITAIYYSTMYDMAIAAAQTPESDGGEIITVAEQTAADAAMKVSAALPTGCPPSVADWSVIRCNMGIQYGSLEESGYERITGSAVLTGSVAESLAMINSVDPSVTSVEEGVFYGSKEDGTLRVLYQPRITHPLTHFSVKSTQDVVEFFTHCFDVSTTISASNQLFMFKEICNLIAMVGLFMLLVPFGGLLLSVPCFASLRGEMAPARPALDNKGKKKFWFGWALGGAVSFVMAAVVAQLFPLTTASTSIFAATTMNAIGLWSLLSAAWGFIWYILCKKKNEVIETPKSSFGEILKSIGLAATIVGMTYAVVWFCKWAFNTDFRFWTPAVKTFNVENLLYFFIYLPAFLAFYYVNSLMTNTLNRIEGMREGKNLFLCGFGNILGCVLIWLIQYGKLIITGTVLWQTTWICVLVILLCMWQLFLAPYLLRGFYKLTGKHWVGALVVSSMYTLCGVMNTAIQSTIL